MNARIGVYVKFGTTASYQHTGFLTFQNYIRTYPNTWNLERPIFDELKSEFIKAGFEVVDVRRKIDPNELDHLSKLIVQNGGKWVVPNDRAAVYKRLKDELNIDLLLVIEEASQQVPLGCKGVCLLPTAGVQSKSSFWGPLFYAAASFKNNIFLLNPPADLVPSVHDPLYVGIRTNRNLLKDFETDISDKELSRRDFDRAEKLMPSLVGWQAGQMIYRLNFLQGDRKYLSDHQKEDW